MKRCEFESLTGTQDSIIKTPTKKIGFMELSKIITKNKVTKNRIKQRPLTAFQNFAFRHENLHCLQYTQDFHYCYCYLHAQVSAPATWTFQTAWLPRYKLMCQGFRRKNIYICVLKPRHRYFFFFLLFTNKYRLLISACEPISEMKYMSHWSTVSRTFFVFFF